MENEHLVVLIRSGENEAENMLQLWQQNKGFIAMMARRYSARAEMEDLEQEGYIALCETVQHYDLDRGMSFISYAAFWIKHRMQICADNNQTVRLPSNAGDEVRKYQKIMRKYQQVYGSTPSDWEMCGFLRVSKVKLDRIRRAAQIGNIRSLEEPAPGLDGDITMGDTVAAGGDMEESTIRKIDREQMKQELQTAINKLPEKQSYVLRKIYRECMTRLSVGEMLGRSAREIGEIERKAIRTLRQRNRSGGLRAYYEGYLAAAPIHHRSLKTFLTTWESEVEREALR